jgi:uncharacterized membrane protein YeaQ/YmgE (transglycosylase-associated protein family)
MIVAAQQASTWSIVVGILVTAFVTGLLARFAVPGPDPMPLWLTLVIGLLASFIGYGIIVAVEGRHTKDVSWGGIASFFVAVGLVIAYRYFIQKRPIWGPGAYRFPKRGVGVENQRERLKRAGIDPDQIGAGGTPFGNVQPGAFTERPAASAHDGPGEPTENPAHYLGLLEVLHDSGVLDDTEYSEARTRLLERLR